MVCPRPAQELRVTTRRDVNVGAQDATVKSDILDMSKHASCMAKELKLKAKHQHHFIVSPVGQSPLTDKQNKLY